MGYLKAGPTIALNKRGSLMDPAATLSSSRRDCLAVIPFMSEFSFRDVRDGVLSNVGCAPTGRRTTVSSTLHCLGSRRPWEAGTPSRPYRLSVVHAEESRRSRTDHRACAPAGDGGISGGRVRGLAAWHLGYR